MVVRVIVFLAGLWVVLYTLLSAIKTVVLPRAATARLTQAVFRVVGAVFQLIAPEKRSYEFRDRVIAYFAPIGLLANVVAWVALVLVGYMLMFWGVRQQGWGDAFFVSGSSLLTLGFASVDTTFERLLAFSEATIGLGIVALLITFLPSLYNAFSHRESQVAMLETRAGSPPTAVEYLTRFHRIGWLDRLDVEFEQWERWFAELEETHTSYPVLNFFRSPQPERSWITAAGCALDTASLRLAALDLPPMPHAALSIRAGYGALRRIAAFFGVAFDSNPAPDDPISIARPEFEAALDELEAAGLAVKADRDQAWRDFAGWRVNYDTVLLSIADLVVAPYAPWVSDRSAPDRTPIRMRRWGRHRHPQEVPIE